MKDEFIIKIITFIDPNNKLHINPIHMTFFLMIALPVLIVNWQSHPVLAPIFTFVIMIQFLLFFLKLLVKDKYKEEIIEIKNSIPSLNVFHIMIFLIITAPLLFIMYAVLSAILGNFF